MTDETRQEKAKAIAEFHGFTLEEVLKWTDQEIEEESFMLFDSDANLNNYEEHRTKQDVQSL